MELPLAVKSEVELLKREAWKKEMLAHADWAGVWAKLMRIGRVLERDLYLPEALEEGFQPALNVIEEHATEESHWTRRQIETRTCMGDLLRSIGKTEESKVHLDLAFGLWLESAHKRDPTRYFKLALSLLKALKEVSKSTCFVQELKARYFSVLDALDGLLNGQDDEWSELIRELILMNDEVDELEKIRIKFCHQNVPLTVLCYEKMRKFDQGSKDRTLSTEETALMLRRRDLFETASSPTTPPRDALVCLEQLDSLSFGDFVYANDSIRVLLRLVDTDVAALFQLGQLYEATNKPSEAIRYLRQYLATTDTPDIMAYFYLGNALDALGSTYHEITQTYENGLKHATSMDDRNMFLDNLEYVSLKFGRFECAREMHRRLHGLTNESPLPTRVGSNNPENLDDKENIITIDNHSDYGDDDIMPHVFESVPNAKMEAIRIEHRYETSVKSSRLFTSDLHLFKRASIIRLDFCALPPSVLPAILHQAGSMSPVLQELSYKGNMIDVSFLGKMADEDVLPASLSSLDLSYCSYIDDPFHDRDICSMMFRLWTRYINLDRLVFTVKMLDPMEVGNPDRHADVSFQYPRRNGSDIPLMVTMTALKQGVAPELLTWMHQHTDETAGRMNTQA